MHFIVVFLIIMSSFSMMFFIRWIFRPALDIARLKKELKPESMVYVAFDTADKKELPFPSIMDSPTRKLSLVVPSYNEEKRLGAMLDETLQYLYDWTKRDPTFSFEIIVVNDGSKDKTRIVAEEYIKKHSSDVIRLLNLRKNRGKGGAVREGMLRSRGSYLLMVDADGATNITDLETLYSQMTSPDELLAVFGSRSHLWKTERRSPLRKLLQFGFRILFFVLISSQCTTSDTQCGFKLFTRSLARQLFTTLHLERWAFDTELIYLSLNNYNGKIVEVEVDWHEVDGSKLITKPLDLILSPLGMFRDMVCVRMCYLLDIWVGKPWYNMLPPISDKNETK